jgi:hypothetical protein
VGSPGPFSGTEVVKVMVNSGIFEWDRTNGDHAILRWEPPDDHDSDARTVPVPLHDEIDTGVSPTRRVRRISMRSERGSSGTDSSRIEQKS